MKAETTIAPFCTVDQEGRPTKMKGSQRRLRRRALLHLRRHLRHRLPRARQAPPRHRPLVPRLPARRLRQLLRRRRPQPKHPIPLPRRRRNPPAARHLRRVPRRRQTRRQAGPLSTRNRSSDPNRPILRRGKPDASAHHEPFVNFDDPAEAAAASKQAGKEAGAAKAAAAASVRTIAAISDAGGPDPRPYTYDLKPAEEAIYRNKMFELAGRSFSERRSRARRRVLLRWRNARRDRSAKTAEASALRSKAAHLRSFEFERAGAGAFRQDAPAPGHHCGSAGTAGDHADRAHQSRRRTAKIVFCANRFAASRSLPQHGIDRRRRCRWRWPRRIVVPAHV